MSAESVVNVRQPTDSDIVVYGQIMGRDAGELLRGRNWGRGTVLVAICGGGPVGSISVNFYGSDLPPFRNERGAYLHSLEVATGFRRKGIDRQLIIKAEDVLKDRGYGSVSIAVYRDNKVATQLYESRGYSQKTEADYGGRRVLFLTKRLS